VYNLETNCKIGRGRSRSNFEQNSAKKNKHSNKGFIASNDETIC
jgi:hypothetical protein